MYLHNTYGYNRIGILFSKKKTLKYISALRIDSLEKVNWTYCIVKRKKGLKYQYVPYFFSDA